MKFGYVLVIGTFILMIWISFIESREIDSTHYPPCLFNAQCSCSKSMPDLGIVKCQNVHLPRIPDTVNISKVFMLHMENNQMRTIDPYFLQATGKCLHQWVHHIILKINVSGLYKIIISRNPLSIVTDEAFMGLERSLWELEISYCDFTRVPNRAIRYLQKLRMLDLTGNY